MGHSRIKLSGHQVSESEGTVSQIISYSHEFAVDNAVYDGRSEKELPAGLQIVFEPGIGTTDMPHFITPDKGPDHEADHDHGDHIQYIVVGNVPENFPSGFYC